MTGHEVWVVADPPGVLMLVCSCGSFRQELPDFEVPLLEVTGRAAEHVASASLQEEMLGHFARGHVQRVQGSPVGMVAACSCEARWPLTVTV